MPGCPLDLQLLHNHPASSLCLHVPSTAGLVAKMDADDLFELCGIVLDDEPIADSEGEAERSKVR